MADPTEIASIIPAVRVVAVGGAVAGADLTITDRWATDGMPPSDETPDAFTFTDVTNAELSTLYESNEIEVTGISAGVSVPVTVAGSTYAKKPSDGAYGAYTSSAGTGSLGDKFKVHHTSSASNSTATNTTLTIGGVSDTFTTTTVAVVADAYIPAFKFNDARNSMYLASV